MVGRALTLLVGFFFHFHSLNSTSEASAVAVMLCQLFRDSYVGMELAWLHSQFLECVLVAECYPKVFLASILALSSLFLSFYLGSVQFVS